MNIKLPDISVNPEKIESLPQARRVINDLLNIIEELATQVRQLSNELQQTKQELARFKKQSKPPEIPTPSSQSQNYSSRKERQQEQPDWKKTAKKPHLTIDREEQLPEVAVCHCGSVSFRIIRTWNKIVQGLIIKRDTVRYLGHDKKCLSCGEIFSSQIPGNILGKGFSSELRSWVSVFKFDCRMSELLILRFLTGLQIQISKGEINQILLENSKKLAGSYVHLRAWGLKISRYLHSDATEFLRRIQGGRKIIKEHLHFVGHEFLSVFTITGAYNSLSIATKVLTKKAMQKIIYISDDASANGRRLLIRLKQLCWIHEIRHYLKLTPSAKANKQKVMAVIDELWTWYFAAKDYGRDPTPEMKQALAEYFDVIMNQVTGYEDLDKRLFLTAKKRARLLLFLDYPGIPIENNLAERDVRLSVLLRKLTGGTRSLEGNRSFERHMSVIQTTRKQGLHVFNTVHGLLNGELSPFVLTKKTLPVITA